MRSRDTRLLNIAGSTLFNDPLSLLGAWISEANPGGLAGQVPMILSTVNSQGQPRSRVVLLKGISATGLHFFTNYDSDKGEEIENNPGVALLFYWPDDELQARVEGIASKLPPGASDAYFATRPRESCIGAWASPQSRELKSFDELKELYEKYEREFENKPVPRPPNWGGYEVIPVSYEFWEGQPGRLHFRLGYTRVNGKWVKRVIAP